MGRDISGWVNNEGGKTKILKNHRNCRLCLENGCYMHVCSLFQVIKHISTDLYVHVILCI